VKRLGYTCQIWRPESCAYGTPLQDPSATYMLFTLRGGDEEAIDASEISYDQIRDVPNQALIYKTC